MILEAPFPLRGLAFDAVTNGLVIVDTNGKDQPIVDVNAAFEAMSGYARSEVLGRNCRFLQGPRTAPALVQAMGAAILAKRPITLTLLNYRKNGESFWNELHLAPIPRNQDSGRFYVGVQTDVTDQFRASTRTRVLARVSAILGSSSEYERALDLVALLMVEEFADRCVIQLNHVGSNDRVVDISREVPDTSPRSHDQESPTELQVTFSARGEAFGSFRLSPPEGHGDYDQLDYEFAAEVGRRIAAAVDSRWLLADAAAGVRARNQFLAIAAHELRTPVAAIKGYAQLLLRADRKGPIAPERLRRSLAAIDHATERLKVLTDDLLDVSRIQLGQLPLRTRRVEFNELIQELVQHYTQTFRPMRQLSLTVASEQCWVDIDPDRLQQVVINLVENAVKHSSENDPIQLIIINEETRITLEVRDGGIGLSPESIEQLFQPFARTPNAIDLNVPGLGLGLYISRGIVARHGGEIWAESQGEGQGARFGFWLPCQADPDSDATKPPAG